MTVVTLVFAGILLCVGFVFLLRNRGWRETAADPPEARQTGLSVSGEHTAKKDNNSTNVINFDEAIHSINSSLERLQSLNDRIHEQNEALIRINQSLSGRRDFSLGTASSRNLQDKPAAGTARKDPIPFSSFHSPAPAPDKPAILTEAEILAIHINRIKTERELNFPQGTGYTGTPQ
ncbi:MAG: hypothetical protein LBQ38_03490 [Spirochaetaceae bacterium]|nr:hypothetical protein [Spirochaetaceae bacterium]